MYVYSTVGLPVYSCTRTEEVLPEISISGSTRTVHVHVHVRVQLYVYTYVYEGTFVL